VAGTLPHTDMQHCNSSLCGCSGLCCPRALVRLLPRPSGDGSVGPTAPNPPESSQPPPAAGSLMDPPHHHYLAGPRGREPVAAARDASPRLLPSRGASCAAAVRHRQQVQQVRPVTSIPSPLLPFLSSPLAQHSERTACDLAGLSIFRPSPLTRSRPHFERSYTVLPAQQQPTIGQLAQAEHVWGAGSSKAGNLWRMSQEYQARPVPKPFGPYCHNTLSSFHGASNLQSEQKAVRPSLP
jgi:hypothetical protein